MVNVTQHKKEAKDFEYHCILEVYKWRQITKATEKFKILKKKHLENETTLAKKFLN